MIAGICRRQPTVGIQRRLLVALPGEFGGLGMRRDRLCLRVSGRTGEQHRQEQSTVHFHITSNSNTADRLLPYVVSASIAAPGSAGQFCEG
jgi:hypothetical protein